MPSRKNFRIKPLLLWRVSTTTTREAEEAVTELLEEIFKRPALSYTKWTSSRSMVSAYLERPPDARDRRQWRVRSAFLQGSGLKAGNLRLTVEKIRREDWAESWKKHFKPIEIGEKLLIRPSWSSRRERAGQVVVELDPGLSFGTGQHPTTSFCLRQLVARRKGGTVQSFLDLGTGSGILAIAAAKLGYRQIDALDLDRDAIRTARANALANHVVALIRFRKQAVSEIRRKVGRRYSMICANLTSDVLRKERDKIIACLEPNGRVVLAGILNSEFPAIRRSYETAGLRLLSSRREREWRSGIFGARGEDRDH